MTEVDHPPLFVVGTRFQMMMALGIIRHLGLADYDLVVLQRAEQPDPSQDLAYSHVIEGARQVSFVPIPALAPLILRQLLRAIGPGKRLILSAHIQNPTILSAFRLRRNLRLHSFDEGSYNISPTGPFFAPPRRKLKRPLDYVMRVLFPKGPLHFARRRSERHYTAFSPEQNFMCDKAVKVEIPWESVAIPSEADQVRGAKRILVLPCMKDFQKRQIVRDRLVKLAQDCDLVVRHPRDEVLPDMDSVLLRSPIEGIVCALAKQSPVTVMHFNSTVGYTLSDNPAIQLVDISTDAPPKFNAPD